MPGRLWGISARRAITRLLAADYVTRGDALSIADKAKSPLRDGRFDVTEIPGKPGVFRAVGFLRPHFHIDAHR